jgi:hypothetical protein
MSQSLLGSIGIATAAVFFAPALTLAAEPAVQIHVIEHATTDTTAHIGPKPDNLGDILTFTNEVFDAEDKARMGTDQGYCVRVSLGKAYECTWTLSLADGQIMVSGPFLDAGDSVLAIIGGTGKYADLRGDMSLHARDAKGSAYDFIYRLRHVATR